MMEIYEVLNQVHSEEEYMEFPEMETAACIRRVRTKLHDNRKKHVWRTIAAALIGGVVLSGGIAYANSEGLLDKFFHNEQTEEVPEQYVEREYIEEDYPNGLKVITNAETKLTFEIEKAITTGDMVDVIWTVTYPDYDAEMYDVDFRMRGGDLYYGDQKLEETSSLILGEESDLKENQRMYDSIYLIPDGMELEEGDVLTMKFDGLNGETTHIDKNDPKYADRDEADLEALYSDTVLIEEADWTLEFALQESKFEPGTLDCSNSAKIVEALEIIMIQRILETGQCKTFYDIGIRDQGNKLSKLFFLLKRDSCPDHADSVSLIQNFDWNMILQSDPQKFNISKQMIDSCSGCSQQRNFLCSKRNCFPDRRFRVRVVFDRV